MSKLNINNFPYKNIREAQKIVLEKLDKNWDDYRYFILELPTGIGKSAIAKTICDSYEKSFLVTATKQLQDQYMKDFTDNNLKSIKGKANYKCFYNNRLNCEIGPCMVNKDLLGDCMKTNICPYYSAKDRALNAKIALTSYAYFLRALDCAGFWKKRNILIFDECHLLEQQIIQWAEMFLSPRELHLTYDLFSDVDAQTFMILTCPPEESGYDKNKIWLEKIWLLVSDKRNSLYADIEKELSNHSGLGPDSLTEEELHLIAVTHKGYYEIDKLYKKLEIFFREANKSDWIVEPENDGLRISPINIGNLFKFYADTWASDKVIFMSATILDIAGFCKELGIPKEKTAVIKMDSTFPPEKSPIVYWPVGSMNYKNLDNTMPKVIDTVNKILEMHPNEKGVIHTSNYRIANEICQSIENERLIMKQEDSNNEMLMKEHARSKIPTVLVSPSLTTGADLKDDLSRFQIFVKMPFASLADKRVKKKIETNNDWYVAGMFRDFIQACGRSTRSEDDWSVTYVLDSSMYYWVYKFKKWFTPNFLKRIIWKKDNYLKKETQ